MNKFIHHFLIALIYSLIICSSANALELELLSPDEVDSLYNTKEPNNNKKNNIQILEKITDAPLKMIGIEAKTNEPGKLEKNLIQEIGENVLDKVQEAKASDTVNDYNINKIWKHNSMMMLPQEIKVFNSAISQHLNPPIISEPLETTDNKTDEQNTNFQEPGKYPIISLDSIMYRTSNNWVAWINGTKFTHNKVSALNGLKIKRISKNKATIHWNRPKVMYSGEDDNFLSKDILNIADPFKIINDGSDELDIYKNITLPNNVVKLDTNNYEITLSPNQSLITSDFQIHEGKVINNKINEIYRKIEARRISNSGNGETNNQTKASNKLEPIDKEKENVSRLLKLYNKYSEPE